MKNKFYNPILQNKGHLKWIQAFLEDQTLPFYSYIVFSDRCTLKDITLTSGTHYVVNRYNLLAAIQQNAAKAGTKISSDKVDDLYQKLYPFTQMDEAGKMIHIQSIQQKRQGSVSPMVSAPTPVPTAKSTPIFISTPTETSNIPPKRCPHCGGELVLRVAKKGKRQGKSFLGCSNYPKCRYVENMSDE